MNNILPPERLVMASRASHPAKMQAKHSQQLLKGFEPCCETSILGMTSGGAQIFVTSIAKIATKGIFNQESETTLLANRAILAIQSLQDAVMDTPQRVALPSMLEIKELH